MENSQEQSYPICYQCGQQLSPQDIQGWEEFKKSDEHGVIIESIWVCPKCMAQTRDSKIVRKLADFKYLLDEVGELDSPINDYEK